MTADPAPAERVLALADIAFARVMAGAAEDVDRLPPDLQPADALRWAGDRVTELLAGFAELPLERLLGLDDDHGAAADPTAEPHRAPAGEPLVVHASSGSVAEVRIWVHLVGPVGPASLRFVLTDLIPAAGEALAGGLAVFAPATLSLPTGVGPSTLLRLPIPLGTAAGDYHGHVLGRGVTGAVVPLTVVVG